MHLTKEDIEHVARSRFYKENTKYYYLLVFGGLAALVAFTLSLARLFPENLYPAASAAILIMGLLGVGVFRYNKLQQRATKELIKQCEADPFLIYVGDTKTETAKDAAIVTK